MTGLDVPEANNPPLLELDDVTVIRGQTRILDSMTLTIPRNQHTVILGPNGSGKTSLLKILVRQFYPSIDHDHGGTVRILGQETWNVAELRKQMGIVSGELDHEFASPRSGRMTGLQAVLSGLDGVKLLSQIQSVDRDSIDAARQSLQRVQAISLQNQTLATMSTGERRRVLIARALVHRPAALVLDEPTTGLDIGSRHRFLQQIETLADAGTTIILVTHHVEEIVAAIQHVVLLKNGRVSAQGTKSQTVGNSPLSELFDYPVNVALDEITGRYAVS